MKKTFNKDNISFFYYLVLLTFVGFYLRCRMLDVKVFWFDEFLTEERSFWDIKTLLTSYMTSRVLIFSIFMKLYGCVILFINGAKYMTEYQLRMPNVILGTLAITVVFFVCQKIKDKIAGIVASLLCTFSVFLIHYSREARFYPLYFLASILLVYTVNNIINERNDGKWCVSSYLLYFCAALIGVYCHSGFWLLFAISNVFLVLFDLIITVKIFIKHNTLQYCFRQIGFFLFRIFILALPILFLVPIFIQMYNEPRRVGHNIDEKLFNLTYETINKISMTFWQASPLSKWMLIIVSIMALSLCLFNSIRIITLYLLSIKFIPFIIASLLPRRIIFEGLRPTYIIFVVLSDIIIIALFISTFTNYLFFLISKFIKINVCFCKLLFAILLILFFAYIELPFVFSSDIYKPYVRLQNLVDGVLFNYKQNTFVVSDDFELDFYLRRALIADIVPKGIKHVVINKLKESTALPDKIDRLLVITSGIINKNIHGSIMKNAGNSWVAIFDINNPITPIDIMALTASVIKSTPMYPYANFNDCLKKWESEYVKNKITRRSNIVNGDFKKGLLYWRGNEEYFSVRDENGETFLSLRPSSIGSKWIYLRQYYESTKDEVYTMSFEARKNDSTTANGKTFLAISDIDENGIDINNLYFQIDTKNLSNDWKKFIKQYTAKRTGCACIRIQTDGNDGLDIRSIKLE